ncbi:glycoside hydrolase family 3 C-terminal domain-containing protein [Lacticaseibacillus yichunensis]|uniref:Glycoside hydrolase family 3 C-terminal domain-containing protein n=1 Tax=Lacticaseibacillus yichunensis TaxID=2486015 RepID=A0ABW4CR07_9LACO|nr:glycoside hydrolase family 3 C-terminal domain-containing protein [Lacticaseibacillus yichunensis]
MTITIKRATGKTTLTDEEAIKLTSGRDFWATEALGDIPNIRMSDGPHGLRYQATAADHLGINEAVAATAFPTASASASSWDPDLLAKMGTAIGEEARSMNVDVVLGPGINIKRNPLGGRSFEYFSEDPLLAGTLASAWIRGLQSTGTGASLKHFAGNSQETARLRSDSLIDATALHELYLEAFRLAVTTAQPETVMIAYNLVNGVYMSDHDYLLGEVLRKQWGFDGMIVSDWGALNDKAASLIAGTDLEMPSSGHIFDKQAARALKQGRLPEASLTRAAEKIAAVADQQRPIFTGNRETLLAENADLAQQIEEQSAVLLKNDGVLPLGDGTRVTVIGALAEETRIQGAGSSHITTPETRSILQGLTAAGHAVDFAPGYQLDGAANAELVREAVAAAGKNDTVILTLGLPATAEAEGNDRSDMALPANQLALVDQLLAVNSNVVVLLVAGSAIELPFASKVRAILHLFLGGERVGAAAARLLFGAVSPSGKLAETLPLRYTDVPSSDLYGRQPLSVPYAESLYVGYRYYDKANVPVAFPFGFGLSYTTFTLSEIEAPTVLTADSVTVSGSVSVSVAVDATVAVTMSNTGSVRGAEVVQVYVGQVDQAQLAPEKTLAAFAKVWLDPGESRRVTLTVPKHAFERWNEPEQAFTLAGGDWQLFVGTSSRDIVTTRPLHVEAPTFRIDAPKWYQQPVGIPTLAAFTELSGLTPADPPSLTKGTFTPLSTPREMAPKSWLVTKLSNVIIGSMQNNDHVTPESPEGRFLATIVWDTPLIRLAQQSGGSLKLWMVRALVWFANH